MNREQLPKIIPAIALEQGFRQEIIEKDFYLTLILNNIYSGLGRSLVFKGGTLLNKMHLNYHRLSEDLDFTLLSEADYDTRSKRSRSITPIREKMAEFLKLLGLKSMKPEGEGFNNSTQYLFEILYPSYITGKDEKIKLEVSLRQLPVESPVLTEVKHFYKDPFTEEDLMPSNKVLSLTFPEAVAEKLKAAITRRALAIRDYYDLWYIAEAGFDFLNSDFIRIFKQKLLEENFNGKYDHNFGLSESSVESLKLCVETELLPVIRIGEGFELEKVFDRFNGTLEKV